MIFCSTIMKEHDQRLRFCPFPAHGCLFNPRLYMPMMVPRAKAQTKLQKL
ncbi:hypothetical protein LINPERHAP2_LOCUS42000, partial [Linum perenne]